MASQTDEFFSNLADRLRSALNLPPTSEKLSPSESKWRELAQSVGSKGWARPFMALASMSGVERDLIRQTLRFSWASETTDCSDPTKRQELEAWEIIDCNIRGVVARLHTIAEQVNPVRYLTWREVLVRTMEMLNKPYKATASEEALEKLVLDAMLADKKVQDRPQTTVPSASIPKIGKTGGIVVSVLKDVAIIWDDLLGSEDGPAVAVIFAICSHVHSRAA